MTKQEIIKERLKTIFSQLDSKQQQELINYLGTPLGPNPLMIDNMNYSQIEFFHDKFIHLQYSEKPQLNGKDIRHIVIYPYINN